jgi:hypothetical protein
MNLYIHQLLFNCRHRCKPSIRENRQNGNEESSQEGTSEKGSRKEGTREEGRKKEVTAVNHQQGNTQRGTIKIVPLSVCGEGIDLLGRKRNGRKPIPGLP